MHSTGSIRSLRTIIARPRTSSGTPSATDSMWLGMIAAVRSNQNAESPVSTAPLSGIGVGWTTSKVEIRSLATSSSASPGHRCRGPCPWRGADISTEARHAGDPRGSSASATPPATARQRRQPDAQAISSSRAMISCGVAYELACSRRSRRDRVRSPAASASSSSRSWIALVAARAGRAAARSGTRRRG